MKTFFSTLRRGVTAAFCFRFKASGLLSSMMVFDLEASLFQVDWYFGDFNWWVEYLRSLRSLFVTAFVSGLPVRTPEPEN